MIITANEDTNLIILPRDIIRLLLPAWFEKRYRCRTHRATGASAIFKLHVSAGYQQVFFLLLHLQLMKTKTDYDGVLRD